MVAGVHPDRVIPGLHPDRGLVMNGTVTAARPSGAGWEADLLVGDAAVTCLCCPPARTAASFASRRSTRPCSVRTTARPMAGARPPRPQSASGLGTGLAGARMGALRHRTITLCYRSGA